MSMYGYDGTLYDGDSGVPTGMGFLGAVAATMGELGTGSYAVVNTNDPPPAGDLKVRSGAGTSYSQIGGVDKGGVVEIIDEANDDQGRFWAKVRWAGGRWPAIEGWVAGWLLKETNAPSPIAPNGGGLVIPTIPSLPGGATVDPGGVPGAPVQPGNLKPASSTDAGMSTGAKVGIVVGVLALGGLAYYALK